MGCPVMAQQVYTKRSRPKHGMFIRLVKEWSDLDVNRTLTGLVLEQRGFEDYDVTVSFGPKVGQRDTIKQKAGRIVIPVQGRDFRREPLDPVTEKELIAAGKAYRTNYSVDLRVEVASDLRGPSLSAFENRLLWLQDRERYMMAKINTVHVVHDQVLVRQLQNEYLAAAQHFKSLYQRWSRYDGKPVAMADYSSSGQLTWAQTSNFSGSSTWPSDASVVFGYAEYSNPTPNPHGSTVDGTQEDDVVQADDAGAGADKEGAVITVHGSPTTGSSVTNATTDIQSGGTNNGACFAVTDTDQSEITTTGFPATATSSASDPTVDLTTAVGDLAVGAYIGYTFDSNPPTYTANTGDSVVLATIQDGEFAYIAYEKATTTTTTVGVTFDAEGNFEALAGAVVPTAAAASEPESLLDGGKLIGGGLLTKGVLVR